MPYCNWCQLDSDTPDVCVWCKRPYNSAAPTSRFGKADLHFLRHDDDGGVDSSFPFFAIAGVLIFVGIISYAVFSFKSSDKKQETALNWNLPSQDAGTVWQPPPVTLPTSTSSRAPAVGQAPLYRPSSTVPHRLDPPSTPNYTLSPTVTNPEVAGAIQDGSAAKSKPVYFESISFALVKDRKDAPHLVGDIVAVNDTSSAMKEGKLWVSIDGSNYPLQLFDGSVDSPQILPPFAIEAKASISCHVMAKGFDGSSKLAGKRVLGLDAQLNGQPLHLQSDVVDQHVEVAQG